MQHSKLYKNSNPLKDMFNKKEIAILIITIIVLAFTITLAKDLDLFLYALLGMFIIIMLNTLAKKIMAFNLDSEIEIKLWEFKRFGVKPKQYFRKAFPAGIFIPLVSRIILLPLNGFAWMASLVFETKAKSYRAAKRKGMYSFSEMTEDHIGFIAAAGILTNLLFALIFYMIGYPFLAKISTWYIFFNLIPISDLDGNKIFFGNLALWSFLATLALIALAYSILLV